MDKEMIKLCDITWIKTLTKEQALRVVSIIQDCCKMEKERNFTQVREMVEGKRADARKFRDESKKRKDETGEMMGRVSVAVYNKLIKDFKAMEGKES